MEVKLKIPNTLMAYLEYIPEDLLPDILTEQLVKCIHEDDIQIAATPQFNVEALISQLQNVMAESAASIHVGNTAVVQEEKPVSQPIASEVKKSALEMVDFDDCDDLADFMDLLK